MQCVLLLMRWSNKRQDQMGRQIDRFSLKCFVTGFIINPVETTAHYPDRWKKMEIYVALNAETCFWEVSSHREMLWTVVHIILKNEKYSSVMYIIKSKILWGIILRFRTGCPVLFMKFKLSIAGLISRTKQSWLILCRSGLNGAGQLKVCQQSFCLFHSSFWKKASWDKNAALTE